MSNFTFSCFEVLLIKRQKWPRKYRWKRTICYDSAKFIVHFLFTILVIILSYRFSPKFITFFNINSEFFYLCFDQKKSESEITKFVSQCELLKFFTQGTFDKSLQSI